MSNLCRFVIPSALSAMEDACVAEFNDYKRRMKETVQKKSANKRPTNAVSSGASGTNRGHDAIHNHPKEPIKNPEDAREVAKKLLQSGAIKVTPQAKDQGFKRASSSNAGQERLNKKLAVTPGTSSPSTSLHSNPFQPIPFVRSESNPQSIPQNSQDQRRNVVNYDDTDNYS